MKKFFKNLCKAYSNCWDSDIMPIWCFIHIIIAVTGIITLYALIPHFFPFLIVVLIIMTIISCLILNWENDEN
jgi:hypothetical protein